MKIKSFLHNVVLIITQSGKSWSLVMASDSFGRKKTTNDIFIYDTCIINNNTNSFVYVFGAVFVIVTVVSGGLGRRLAYAVKKLNPVYAVHVYPVTGIRLG